MHKITLIRGDGVGKEILGAVKEIIDATKINLKWDERIAGQEAFSMGVESGICADTVDSIRESRVVLKGPLETPVGYGNASANVALRKLCQTYANLRPIFSLPNVHTPFNNVNMVILRENLEDLYAGIEYGFNREVSTGLKLISSKGCGKILKAAFSFANNMQYKSIHFAHKANILKKTEGMFKNVAQQMAKEYPQIQAHSIIIDNCAHQLVINPQQFNLIVCTNLHGDIISDLASGLVGGLGLAPSANLGREYAIFEAVHGSAPDIAGLNVVNPTASLLSGIMMLRYLGYFKEAHLIDQAL